MLLTPHYTDTHGDTPLERFDSYCENGTEALAAAEAGFFLCPTRDDLPSVSEIIELSIQQREHFIRNHCLIGMGLRWRQGASFVDALGDDAMRRMLAFRLTYDAGNTPEWFTHLEGESLFGYWMSVGRASSDANHWPECENGRCPEL